MLSPLRWPLYPPVWFLSHLGLAWGVSAWTESPWPFMPWQREIGGVVAMAGLLLTLLAILTVHRARTPVLPYRQPECLIVSGPFHLSRNPIYLGEAFILSGLALRSTECLPFLVLPGFVLGLTWGAIRWEEAALRQRFGPSYRDYCQRTRRWL